MNMFNNYSLGPLDPAVAIKSEIKEEKPQNGPTYATLNNHQMLFPYLPLPPMSPKSNGHANLNQLQEVENPHCKRKPLPLQMCPICKKYFRRLSAHLQNHAEKPLPPSPLSCQYCQKTFSNLGNLQIHVRIHTGTKPYKCDECSKAFSQSSNLTNHKRIHTGEKPFQCPHCCKAFAQSGGLTNHIRIHLNLKPFKCHFCDKAFTQAGNLNSHLKNNHS